MSDADSSLKIDCQEISTAILEGGFLVHPAVVDGKIKELPLREIGLHWEDFERLTARLVKWVFNGSISQALRYGHPGQKQHGIDIVAIRPEERVTYVVQCKHVKNIPRGKLTAWVNEFQKGSRSSDVKKYILCTSFSIESDTALVDEWKQCTFALASAQIDAELWDFGKLQQLLRDAEPIVIEIFGSDVANRFCTSKSISLPMPVQTRFRPEYVSASNGSVVIENETVRLEMILPGHRGRALSALLSFARTDLNGVMLGVEGNELVGWLHWRSSMEDLSQRPYAPQVPDQDQWVFSTAVVRLILGADEIAHLDWVLAIGWRHFIDAAVAVEARWKTLQFSRIELGEERPTYALIKVTRRLWRSMLAFVQEHDCANGNSEWHIFDAAPGLIKVYVDHATSSLDRGYHVFLHAFNEPGICLPWDDEVVIGWSAMTNDSGGEKELSPRKAWDAEYTHKWLLEGFIPEVLRWNERCHQPSKKLWRSWSRRERIGAKNSHDVSKWCQSLALCSSRSLNVSSENIVEVRSFVGELQRHFHGGTQYPETSKLLTENVLRALERAIPFAQSLDEHYIRGKLPLEENLDLQRAVRTLVETDKDLGGRWWLDLALRCLWVVLEDTASVPSYELSYTIDLLGPVWSKFREDLLCRST